MSKCIKPGHYGRCRKCSGCLDARLRSWVLRLILESMLYPPEETSFLTLTYKNSELPPDEKTAVDQLQKFFKRLRKDYAFAGRLRYVAALEKGTQSTKRFHWHCILFGVPLSVSNRHFLRKKWGHGFLDWLPASAGRMAYVCKYAIKGGKFLMSRNPGIGDGMIGYISHAISNLSDVELQRMRDKSHGEFLADNFIEKVSNYGGPLTRKFGKEYHQERHTISSLKVGGYYFPLHDFLKKRLQHVKKETKKC